MPQQRPRRARDNVDAEDFRTACQMFQDGAGLHTIGAFLNRADKVIGAWVGGLKRGSRTWNLGSPEERQMARDLAGKDVTATEIAGLLGRPPGTITEWMKDPDRGERRAEITQRVAASIRQAKTLRDCEGMNNAQIAREMGVSQSTAARWLQRADDQK